MADSTVVTLRQLVRRRKSSVAPALLAPGREALSYCMLADFTDSVGRSLRENGIGASDRVGLVCPNGPEAASAFLSIAGWASCAPLNPDYNEKEFSFYLEDLGTRALVVCDNGNSPARKAARRLGIRIFDLLPGDGPAGLFELRDGDRGGRPGRNDQEGAQGVDGTEIAHPGPDDEALVLHTSGTTSRPKIVPLLNRNICASARNISRTLALSADDRCLNVMPLFHIHGLMAALSASIYSGASVICTAGFEAPRFFSWLARMKATWYTAVPTIHQAVLAQAERDPALPAAVRLRFVRSSSASLPPSVLVEIEETFKAPMIEAYGMTEAAHQMTSNPLPPASRKPGSVGPAAGPRVAVMNGDGVLLETGRTGEIVIRGDNVTPGYQGNPRANGEAFVNGWFRTGDEGFLDEDGYLTITGRLKEIINRGGEKISPREIDEVLLGHPAVAQAVTFALAHPVLGEEVGAACVRADGRSGDDPALERELKRYVARRLVHFKVPRKIVFPSAIPKGPTGKLQRIGLAGRLGVVLEENTGSEEAAAPATNLGRDDAALDDTMSSLTAPLEEDIRRWWSDLLGTDRTGAGDRFFASGGDSVLAVRLLSRINEKYGVDLTLQELLEKPTVSGMARAVVEFIVDEMESDQCNEGLSRS